MAGSLANRSIYSESLRTGRFIYVRDRSKFISQINCWVFEYLGRFSKCCGTRYGPKAEVMHTKPEGLRIHNMNLVEQSNNTTIRPATHTTVAKLYGQVACILLFCCIFEDIEEKIYESPPTQTFVKSYDYGQTNLQTLFLGKIETKNWTIGLLERRSFVQAVHTNCRDSRRFLTMHCE